MSPPRPSSSLPTSLSSFLASSHPSTDTFLRAFALGWAAHTLPSLLRLVLATAKSSRRSSSRPQLRNLLLALVAALRPGRLALAAGVAFGGAQCADGIVEPIVRRAYFSAVVRARALREGKGKARETEASLEREQQQVIQDERNVRALSTFVGGSLSSLAALLILQRSKRPTTSRASPDGDERLAFTVTPYPPTVSSDPSSPPTNGTLPSTFSARVAPAPALQSPTLDLTLFIFVRAADALIRFSHERLSPRLLRTRLAPLLTLAASHGDLLLFVLSAWRIMWAWFYQPHLLPPSYGRWILQLARMDPRLLSLLQFARGRRYVYGKEPDVEVMSMCEGIARHAGTDVNLVNPARISRLDCSFVHGRLGAGSCETNAAKRWARAFLDALLIYLPVHAIPPLLFNFRRVLRDPSSSLLRILLAASRSSAFLATFIASVYAAVCLTRTRLPILLPSVSPPQQSLDAGLCVLAGTFACGWSVLLENKRRRREMALYCAPRALYAVLDELVPAALQRGKTGECLACWAERTVFALSSGTVIAAAVHRPDLISGVVRGVASFAVGRWGGAAEGRKKGQ
ncbi:hypothetical protein JCM10207_002373 [Rhodosporidiobolus poonsookiae]